MSSRNSTDRICRAAARVSSILSAIPIERDPFTDEKVRAEFERLGKCVQAMDEFLQEHCPDIVQKLRERYGGHVKKL